MREVTERRQQLEQEQEQALAILNFKQNEVKRLQRAQFAAKREHEGVVQMLESTVLELEEKCRTQSQQFTLLSHELERFRLQTGDAPDRELCQLTNGLEEPAFTHHASGLSRPQCPPVPRRRVLPTISLKPGCPASAARPRHPAPNPVPVLRHTHTHTHTPAFAQEGAVAREGKARHINASPVAKASGGAAATVKVFVVKYSYDPNHGPNNSPETELPLLAGEYVCVYGDIDEDGFYEGELMDGRRGLVPSNFVEPVSHDNAVCFPSPAAPVPPPCSSLRGGGCHGDEGRPHPRCIRRSRPPAPNEGTSPPTTNEGLLPPITNEGVSPPTTNDGGSPPTTNGIDVDSEEPGADAVPYPRGLTLIKQLARSVVIGWEPPPLPPGWGSVRSYNVYVDEEPRLSVPSGVRTQAVLERLDVGLKAYRVSVQSVTEKGVSDALRCTLLVGRGVCMAPARLRAERVAPAAVRLTWLPGDSSYTHTVSLSDGERWLVKAGCYSLSLRDLASGRLYLAKVEARSTRTPWDISREGRERKSASVTFSTAATGPPAPPLNVQVEVGPSPGVALISWLPVSCDADGTSNGVPVTGYTIYVDKRKVLEVSSPTAASALLGPSQIHALQSVRELTVRTMSPQGESVHSAPVRVPQALHRSTSTGRTSVLRPEVSSISSSIAVHTSEAVQRESVGMNVPTITVSSAEPSAPTSPAPGSPRETDPGGSQRSPLEPHTEDGSSRESESPDRAPYAESRDHSSLKTPQSCGSRLTEAQREEAGLDSDLNSDLPQEEEGLGSDNPGEDSKTDSDEEVLERILRTETPHSKQLFSIPEVTEEEDSCQEPEDPVLPKSPEIQHLLPGQDKPAATNSPAHRSKSPDDSAHRSKSLYDSAHHSKSLYDSAHHSKSQDDSAHRSKSLYDSAHHSKSPNDSAHCFKILDGPTQRSMISVDSAHHSKSSDDSAHHSKSSDDSAHRSKSPDGPTHRSMISVDSAHHPKSTDDSAYRSKSPDVPASRSAPVTQDRSSRGPEPPEPRLRLSRDPGGEGPREARDLSTYSTFPRPRTKPHHRVHHSHTVDTSSYQREEWGSDSSARTPSKEARRRRQRSRRPPHQRGVSERSSDLPREEIVLRDPTTSDRPASGRYLGGWTVVRTRAPASSGMEIDVEYGTEEEVEAPTPTFDPADEGVVLEQMSSEWWVLGELRERPQRRQPAEVAAKVKLHPGYQRRESAGAPGMGGAGSGERGRPGGLAVQRQDCYTPSPQRARLDRGRARSYSASGGNKREDLVHGGPQLASRSPTATRMEARQHKDGCQDPEGPALGDGARIFVALFSYDPSIMSPNPHSAQEELPFQEGQIIKVFGNKDVDGFFLGESRGRYGYVPCNMVSEIQPEDEAARDRLLRIGFLSPEPSRDPEDPSRPAKANLTPRKMVAIFDYDPQESSPNTDIETELCFSAGDVIYVYGDMEEDGFFYGDLNGQRGLVPSNFLQDVPVSPPEVPESRPGSQRQRRKSVYALNP